MPEALGTASDQPAARSLARSGTSRSNSRSRVRYHAALKFIRRVHMYFELFLLPWVFLYGVSAFLFNHPDAFPDREVRTLDRSEIAYAGSGRLRSISWPRPWSSGVARAC